MSRFYGSLSISPLLAGRFAIQIHKYNMAQQTVNDLNVSLSRWLSALDYSAWWAESSHRPEVNSRSGKKFFGSISLAGTLWD